MNASTVALDLEHPASWKQLWWMVCIMALCILILFLFFVHLPTRSSENTNTENSTVHVAFKNKNIWILAFIMFTFALNTCVSNSFISLYCQQVLMLPLNKANTLSSVMPLGMIIGGILVGLLLNKTQQYTRILLAGSVLLTFFCTILFLCPQTYILPVIALTGLVLSILPPVIYSLGAQFSVSPQLVGLSMGIIAFGNSFATIGTTLQGYVLDTFGWTGAAIVQCIFGLLCVASSLLLSFQCRRSAEK